MPEVIWESTQVIPEATEKWSNCTTKNSTQNCTSFHFLFSSLYAFKKPIQIHEHYSGYWVWDILQEASSCSVLSWIQNQFRVLSLNHMTFFFLSCLKEGTKVNKCDLHHETREQSQDSSWSLLISIWIFSYHTSVSQKYIPGSKENSKRLLT